MPQLHSRCHFYSQENEYLFTLCISHHPSLGLFPDHFLLLQGLSVMGNFMCELGLFTYAPKLAIPGISVKVVWMTWTFESVEWINKMTLPSAGGFHSISRSLDRMSERQTFLTGKANSFTRWPQAATLFFSFGLQSKYWIFLGLKPMGFPRGATLSAVLDWAGVSLLTVDFGTHQPA